MKKAIAKLTRPRVAGIVERKRLLDHLTAISSNKIIWISAPAGSGKTTLVANWIEHRNLPCLWYQADEGEADIASFFSYLGKAAKHAAPRFRTPLPLFTPEYRFGIPTFTKRYFEALFHRLKPPFCFVIDNYQEVRADTLFHEVIRDGFSAAPEGFFIVVVSRADPPPVFSRLQAAGRLEVIDRREIGFTLSESRELVKSRGKKLPPDESLHVLHQKTEGWAAGLVLLMESKGWQNGLSEVGRIPSELIFDYFASELYEQTDDETKRFLLATSFLPRMTAETAADLTGNSRSEQILSRLNRANLFTQRHEASEIYYQYHPLFQDFLKHRVCDEFSADRVRDVKKRAALLLLKADQPEDAARLLIDTEDWRGLTELTLRYASSYIASGRFLTIGSWINTIPEEFVERTAWLLYWKALCRLSTRPAEARTNLEKAYTLFQDEGDASGTFSSWAGIVDTYLYEWKDFKPLDRWIGEFEKLSEQYRRFPSQDIEERTTSAIFSALVFRQPQHPDLPRWAERVSDIMMNSAELSHRVFIGHNLVLYYLWTGRVSDAGSVVSLLSSVTRQSQAAPLPRLMWLRNESLYNYYVSQTEAGLRAVEEGLRLAEETGVHLLDVMFHGVAIYHATLRDDLALAERYLRGMAAGVGQGGCYANIYYAAQSSLVAMLRGDVNTAVSQAETSVRLTGEAGFPLIYNSNLTALIHVRIEFDLFDRIGTYIAELRQRAATTRSAHIEAWCSCFEAQIAMKEGNDDRFSELLRRTMEICKQTGLRLITFRGRTLARLCSKALELGVVTDFVKEIIGMNNLMPDVSGKVPEAWPWPIKIYTLGTFELVIDGKPVVFSGKGQQKPLAMLKALIAFGGREASDKMLTDALWPEAEGDLGRSSFDTTLHRLRRLLGDERIVKMQDGKVSLDGTICWVDVWAFEEAVRGAESGVRSEDRNADKQRSATRNPESGIARLEKAIALYRGHFLPAEGDAPWALSLRERLRSKYLNAVSRFGRFQEESDEYEKAAEVFRRGLDVDDLSEEFYQRLMLCYHQLGRKAEAATTYRRCRETLLQKLDLTPSEKTMEIYRKIMA